MKFFLQNKKLILLTFIRFLLMLSKIPTSNSKLICEPTFKSPGDNYECELDDPD